VRFGRNHSCKKVDPQHSFHSHGRPSIARESTIDDLLITQNYWLPTIRAQIELNNGHAERALALLEPVKPFDLAPAIPPMYPVYLRGQAYLGAGNGAAAVTEFQKILDLRSFVANDVAGALAHLYLGRAHTLEARSLRGAAAWRSGALDIRTKVQYPRSARPPTIRGERPS
jgi:hypothetical protein